MTARTKRLLKSFRIWSPRYQPVIWPAANVQIAPIVQIHCACGARIWVCVWIVTLIWHRFPMVNVWIGQRITMNVHRKRAAETKQMSKFAQVTKLAAIADLILLVDGVILVLDPELDIVIWEVLVDL